MANQVRVREGGVPCDPQEMLALVRSGNMEALDRITRCHGERLIAVGRRYCRSEEEAQDAVQDALLSAGAHLSSFRGDGSLEGWLVRMVANACHRMRRGRKNDPGLHETEREVSFGGDTPETEAAHGRLAEILGQALFSLAPEDRVIFLLSEGEDWTGPEIAAELDLSPGAVRTRLTRIRQKLRKELEGLGSELGLAGKQAEA